MDNKVMENYGLLTITNDFLCKQDIGTGIGKFCGILYGKKLIPKKIKNIRKKYAAYDVDSEVPILIFDDTVFGSARRGFLLTNRALYYHLFPVKNGLPIKGSIRLSSITEVQIECLEKTSNLTVNNERIAHLSAFSLKLPYVLEANVLNELFNLYMEYLHPEKISKG